VKIGILGSGLMGGKQLAYEGDRGPELAYRFEYFSA
jgi:hypothetical protein